MTTGLIDRLSTRAQAEAEGEAATPIRYYELRDEWMAKAVTALADSIAGPRKVIVWLHNDHARYGDLDPSSGGHRSQGSYLREIYGDDVFSIGFFMGEGVIADNGRTEQPVAPLPDDGIETFLDSSDSPSSYLVLRGNTDPMISEWASRSLPYLRMGLTELEMVPADEFDALFYIRRVGPPDYAVR